jgi:hypothetical protein
MIGEAAGLTDFLFLYGIIQSLVVNIFGYDIGEFGCFTSQQIYVDFNQRIPVDPPLIKATLCTLACFTGWQMTALTKRPFGFFAYQTFLDCSGARLGLGPFHLIAVRFCAALL